MAEVAVDVAVDVVLVAGAGIGTAALMIMNYKYRLLGGWNSKSWWDRVVLQVYHIIIITIDRIEWNQKSEVLEHYEDNQNKNDLQDDIKNDGATSDIVNTQKIQLW